MKTAIITGIGGQDGAYLAQHLISLGYRVIGTTRSVAAFDELRLRYLGIADQVQIVRLQEITISTVSDLLFMYKPSEVYNLAAQSSVSASFKEPFQTIEYNVLSVLAWVKSIADHAPETRFYQASSSEMFGNIAEDRLPLRENVIFHPASPYGISKATAHWIAVNFRESHNLFCANGILFNHESCLRGENYVIKKIISHLVRIHRTGIHSPIQVGNTQIRRDWGYAPDYVKAMHLVLQRSLPDDYLICSGNVSSLDEFIQSACDLLQIDKGSTIQHDPSLYRPNELMAIYGDPAKAKSLLGWHYSLSNKELLKKLIEDEIRFQEWREKKY